MNTRGCCFAVVIVSILIVGCARPPSVAKLQATAETESPAPADVVVLKDNSRLVGQVQRLTDGKLTMKTDYAGTLILDMGKVESITTERILNVRVKDGDSVLGGLRHDAKDGQQVRSDAMGERAILIEKLDAIWPVGEDSPELAAMKKKLELERPKWSFRVEAGVKGETGNTEKISSNARVEVRRKTPKDRMLLYFEGRHSNENGQDSEKEFIGGAKLEVDVSKKLFAWGRTEFEHDPFEDMNLRSTATGGLGYFFLREEDQWLKVLGGLGFRHESFQSGGTEGRIIGEAALDYMKEIAPWLRFKHDTVYNPSFEDLGDYRITMENSAEIPLAKGSDWKIRLGIKNVYTAIPSPDVDRRLATTYFANLVWTP